MVGGCLPGAVPHLLSAWNSHGGGRDRTLVVLCVALAAAVLRAFSFIDSNDGLHELFCRRIYHDGHSAIYGNLRSQGFGGCRLFDFTRRNRPFYFAGTMGLCGSPLYCMAYFFNDVCHPA